MTRLVAVQPSKDVAAAIAYYVDRLGFKLTFSDSDADPRYAGLRRDGVEIHLQWHSPEEWERDGVDRPMLRFATEGIGALFEEYADRDVFHAQTALRITAWGTEEFAFYDGDGNGLTFYRNLDGGE